MSTMQRPTTVPTVAVPASLTSYEQYVASVTAAACSVAIEPQSDAGCARVESSAPVTAILPDPTAKWWLAGN
jgi:hypothetical protein